MTTLIELTPTSGRVHVRTTSGLLRPQVRSTTATTARITLVATGATLLGGDHVDLTIRVGPGLTLDLSDVAGTVVYDGRGASCSWSTAIELAEGSTLIWHGEPVVISDGGHLMRRTQVDMSVSARLLLRDTLTFGRTAETGGALSCRTRMNQDGLPILAEDLELSAEQRTWPGMLGDAKVIDTITALGWQPTPPPLGLLRSFDLPGTGLLARALVTRAHLSPAAASWATWHDEVTSA